MKMHEKIKAEFPDYLDELKINQVISENSEEILEKAFKRFLESKAKYPKFSSFERQIGWVSEQSQSRSKTQHHGKSKSNSREIQAYTKLIKKYPDRVDFIKDQHYQKNMSVAYISAMIDLEMVGNEREKHHEDFPKYWKHTSMEGKKFLIDSFLEKVMSNPMMQQALNQTRSSMLGLGIEDPEQEAYQLVIRNFFLNCSTDMEKYLIENAEKFDSYAYYRRKLTIELGKRGL